MAKKIRCPFHLEKTPSCVLYKNGYWCAGCGAKGPLSEIAGIKPEDIEEPEPEDLEASLSAIAQLPKRVIRGLELPCDERSFYIVWPCGRYYKRRFFHPTKVKYMGATGHTKPLFVAQVGTADVTVVVEGELNALSIALACPEFTVISPGGSAHFEPRFIRKDLAYYTNRATIVVLCDEDIAGAKAAIDMLSELRHTRKQLLWKLVARDANQVLQEDGRERLREEILQILRGPVAKGVE